jgi:hypothetical protein
VPISRRTVRPQSVEAKAFLSFVAFHFPVGVSDDFADRSGCPQDFGSLCPRWNVNSARKLLVRGIKPFSKALGAVGVTDKLNIYGDILLVVARN